LGTFKVGLRFSKRKPKQNCGDNLRHNFGRSRSESFEYADPNDSEGNAQIFNLTKILHKFYTNFK
ncbi:MAG: hypothetical protein P1P64_02850, partial [Treponemataceae bacterium]